MKFTVKSQIETQLLFTNTPKPIFFKVEVLRNKTICLEISVVYKKGLDYLETCVYIQNFTSCHLHSIIGNTL